jgi:hypothetical protein
MKRMKLRKEAKKRLRQVIQAISKPELFRDSKGRLLEKFSLTALWNRHDQTGATLIISQ